MSARISVLMPVYNGEKYLNEAIDSILNQTFTDFEFLIIDDGSTDASREIIQSYGDSRIKLITNAHNIGVAKSLNKGLQAARGTYVARMDADDVALPNRLQEQYDFMEAHPGVDILGTWLEVVGQEKGIVKFPLEHVDIRDALFYFCSLAHPTIMMRKNELIRYDEEFSSAQDYELWCRLADSVTFANISQVLMKYRVHEHQVSVAKTVRQNRNADKIRRRNLEKIGVFFNDALFDAYLAIINDTFVINSPADAAVFNRILHDVFIHGIQHQYGDYFRTKLLNLWLLKYWIYAPKSLRYWWSFFRVSLHRHTDISVVVKFRVFLRAIKWSVFPREQKND